MATAKTAGRDTTAEIAFLTRALKAPTLRESVDRLAQRADRFSIVSAREQCTRVADQLSESLSLSHARIPPQVEWAGRTLGTVGAEVAEYLALGVLSSVFTTKRQHQIVHISRPAADGSVAR